MCRSLEAVVFGAVLALLPAVATAADGSFDESWWAVVGADGAQHVQVRCGTNFVDPRQVVVKANVPVVLTVSAPQAQVASHFVLQVAGSSAGAIDAPVGSLPRTFAFSTGLAGRYVMACRDAAAAAGSPPPPERTGALTVRP